MHSRRVYIAALKEQLQQVPQFGRRVFNQRTPPRNQWPAVTIYAVNEPVETETIHLAPRPQERSLSFSVGIYVKLTQDAEKIEDDIDNYAELIESALALPTGATDLQLLETRFPEVFQLEEELAVEETTLVYLLRYNTTEQNP